MGILKYALSKGAEPPVKATAGAAGHDCFAMSREFLTYKNGEFINIDPADAKQNDLIRYSSGITMEIPKGHAILTFARSSIVKMPLIMANTTGIIDSDYRGEVVFMFRILDPKDITQTSYQVGERVGQLLLVKLGEYDLAQTEKLSDTNRGSGAYGSTGR